MKVYVSGDAAAVALGADEVAAQITAALLPRSISVVRPGSRGYLPAEPLVEVETPTGRVAYGPIFEEDVPSLLPVLLEAGPHPRRLGRLEEHPFFVGQRRLTFARVGIIDPRSWSDFVAHGGLEGLTRARALAPSEIIARINNSGLRGRGGAGFPAGLKWKTAAEAPGARKFIVCNADEGDSGTFADRMLMEGDPFLLIEGMMIAALAIGATRGYVYLRSEYPQAIATMTAALATARSEGLLSASFDIELRIGAGAYVCGEETALLESIEGKRGVVRAKPPLPAHQGLFGCPTVVNNVLTLAAVPHILASGPEVYAGFGIGRSRGTMPIQLAGNLKHTGLYEVPFGLTLGQLVDEVGGGSLSGRPIRAVQVGGPLGAYFPRALFDTPFDYEAFTAKKGLIGHGGVVAFDDTVDLAAQARFAMEFCAVESCGKCTPCRIGSTRGVEVIDRIRGDQDRAANLVVLQDLCETLRFGSLCALGGFVPYPVESALQHFPEDFQRAPQATGPGLLPGRSQR